MLVSRPSGASPASMTSCIGRWNITASRMCWSAAAARRGARPLPRRAESRPAAELTSSPARVPTVPIAAVQRSRTAMVSAASATTRYIRPAKATVVLRPRVSVCVRPRPLPQAYCRAVE
ncbi:hypothetical protein GCM10017779_26120 [Streptomyces capillispiralis]|nr:hypothetical protein GCM10017779_26120 [Streptomyces capillispiralis]